MKILVALLAYAILACNGGYITNKLDLDDANTTETDSPELVTTTIIPVFNDENEEVVTNSSYLETVTSNFLNSSVTVNLTSSKTPELESEIQYLEFEYGHLDRETFWKNNSFECINGTLLPSQYLRKKYRQCERIHQNINPECTTNCQMAITMLLKSRAPNLDLFKRYFQITLPENLQEKAIRHYSDCFEKFGMMEDLLDNSCKKPQSFFACMLEFQTQMVCQEENDSGSG